MATIKKPFLPLPPGLEQLAGSPGGGVGPPLPGVGPPLPPPKLGQGRETQTPRERQPALPTRRLEPSAAPMPIQRSAMAPQMPKEPTPQAGAARLAAPSLPLNPMAAPPGAPPLASPAPRSLALPMGGGGGRGTPMFGKAGGLLGGGFGVPGGGAGGDDDILQILQMLLGGQGGV